LCRRRFALRYDGTISPGFFDLQVNGGSGVLFNTTPTVQGALTIAQAHRQFGTTAILPTVITDAPEVLDAACDAILESAGQNGIAGIHIEGPHISVARHGTHAIKYIRPLDARTIERVRQLRSHDITTLITLAPEAVRPGQIADLVTTGAVVSLGHSDATAAQTRAALAEGAQLFTHVFNAMSPMQNREPGVTGAAINSDAYCSIICDGIHVSGEMVGLAIRARPTPGRMIIVSDAMSTVGGPDSLELYGDVIHLKQGRLINSSGSLAGAHTTMAKSIGYLVTTLDIPLETALRMAITNPARLMGLSDRFMLLGADVDDCVCLATDFSNSFTDGLNGSVSLLNKQLT
jgi:N-acetylglucosamine-6-phosphate deacetylase